MPHKQTTLAAYFDKTRPSSRSGRSSSSVSDLSETGEDEEQNLSVTGLGPEVSSEDDGFSLLSCTESSSSWDPFGLSSSQSSETETGSTPEPENEGDSRGDRESARLKAAPCTNPVDSATDSVSRFSSRRCFINGLFLLDPIVQNLVASVGFELMAAGGRLLYSQHSSHLVCKAPLEPVSLLTLG
ncbi:unnamed protein product [Dibothriocephalus latus]|uniref:Uncharacterized protein n=1 Tax=Dibothriocephalus latus TaxID=60516 RepID=A0A3P7R1G3_DIBLA|nr:unnamed protein product [Dibothriocephalus latus]